MTTITRTHKLFAVGFFALTFGCKGAGAAKALGVAAVTTAKVASAAAIVAASDRRGPEPVLEGEPVAVVAQPVVYAPPPPVAAPPACSHLCPAMGPSGPVYVCARETPGYDAAGQPAIFVSCR
ncbi:MAG TPA: hypothetical protein VGM56_14005 [Byssovorax sp.]|jgi:hypothetical protein